MTAKTARGYVFIATSMDGFVARENHSIDWLMKYDSGEEDQGYDDFISNIDVLVMGSGSFKTVLGFGTWPYQIPVYVMSKTLITNDVPKSLRDKVIISKLSPLELMESFFNKGIRNAYVDGGKLVQSFIREGLIKELTITQIPILIGSGKRLFGAIENDIDLELMRSKVYSLGFVQNKYRIINK